MVVAAFCFLLAASWAQAQEGSAKQNSALTWSELVANHYMLYPDQVYGKANNIDLKLNVWRNVEAHGDVPTVVYIHGGGWIWFHRDGAVPELLPYLEKGWDVVNVEYRLADQSLAPAAVEDSRCALRWIYRNAKRFHFDTSRIIVTGHSAGGHLALMTGMLTASAGFDNNCAAGPGEPPLKVAAIVSWFGISDVADMLSGPDRRNYALMWLGGQGTEAERVRLARRLSPLSYVRPGLPPIIQIHGTADPTVPYSQAVRLQRALDKAQDVNELVSIPGGKHGFQAFSDAETIRAYKKVFTFLNKNVPGLKH